MPRLIVLFEHSVGYSLFDVAEFEDIGAFLPQVEKSVTDFSRFNKVVNLLAFYPFPDSIAALEAINCLTEGVAPGTLKTFLSFNFPKKKKKAVLGISDPKLGTNLTETLEISCQIDGVVPEIIRGIRRHFVHFVANLDTKTLNTAELAVAHCYSRAKVKFNINRADVNIIHAIWTLDNLDKDLNKFSMRLREWYSYHFPELYKIVPDNSLFAKAVLIIGNKKDITDEKIEELEEVLQDASKAEAVAKAAKSSMGVEISELDCVQVTRLAKEIVRLVDTRSNMFGYLKVCMAAIAPNLTALLGEQVGARLISKAGSLTNLAKCPASTVQIMGAEKALFRALKTRSNTPKYGLLYNSHFIGKAGTENKGRISRFLANKCSIATRVDCFSDNLNNIIGEKLRQQVEDRLKFYETGDLPNKNEDVMKEAIAEIIQYQEMEAANAKKKKKKKKNVSDSVEDGTFALETTETSGILSLNGEAEDVEIPKKKKKKKKNVNDSIEDSALAIETMETSGILSVNGESEDTEFPKKKKKKKKSVNDSIGDGTYELKTTEAPEINGEGDDIEIPKKKKKKRKNADSLVGNSTLEELEIPKKKKKNKTNVNFNDE